MTKNQTFLKAGSDTFGIEHWFSNYLLLQAQLTTKDLIRFRLPTTYSIKLSLLPWYLGVWPKNHSPTCHFSSQKPPLYFPTPLLSHAVSPSPGFTKPTLIPSDASSSGKPWIYQTHSNPLRCLLFWEVFPDLPQLWSQSRHPVLPGNMATTSHLSPFVLPEYEGLDPMHFHIVAVCTLMASGQCHSVWVAGMTEGRAK